MNIDTIDTSLGGYEYADKVEHAAVGAVLGIAGYEALRALWPEQKPAVRFVEALVPVVVAGVAKEMYDAHHHDHHDSDWRDAAATIGGGVVAVSIRIAF